MQEVVLAKRVAQPVIAAIEPDEEPENGIVQETVFVILAAGLFCRAGVVDVT